MNVQLSQPAPVSACAMPSTQPSLVVMTSVDGTLCHGSSGASDDVRGALTFLGTRGVPVVFASHRRAEWLMTLQETAGVHVPLIADGGATLCIPSGYFGDRPGFGRNDGAWTVVECARTRRTGAADLERAAQAIRLLVSLYRVSAEDVVTIGIGSGWSDRVLLREVDVPVIVRRDDVDQERLRGAFPAAYVTYAAGPLGWSEAILGASDV
jgi:predicted mannosyl-3-phosphoglycerate phosphatase (HAD superfamily)